MSCGFKRLMWVATWATWHSCESNMIGVELSGERTHCKWLIVRVIDHLLKSFRHGIDHFYLNTNHVFSGQGVYSTILKSVPCHLDVGRLLTLDKRCWLSCAMSCLCEVLAWFFFSSEQVCILLATFNSIALF